MAPIFDYPGTSITGWLNYKDLLQELNMITRRITNCARLTLVARSENLIYLYRRLPSDLLPCRLTSTTLLTVDEH
jgi:hypothetical protein